MALTKLDSHSSQLNRRTTDINWRFSSPPHTFPFQNGECAENCSSTPGRKTVSAHTELALERMKWRKVRALFFHAAVADGKWWALAASVLRATHPPSHPPTHPASRGIRAVRRGLERPGRRIPASTVLSHTHTCRANFCRGGGAKKSGRKCVRRGVELALSLSLSHAWRHPRMLLERCKYFSYLLCGSGSGAEREMQTPSFLFSTRRERERERKKMDRYLQPIYVCASCFPLICRCIYGRAHPRPLWRAFKKQPSFSSLIFFLALALQLFFICIFQ